MKCHRILGVSDARISSSAETLDVRESGSRMFVERCRRSEFGKRQGEGQSEQAGAGEPVKGGPEATRRRVEFRSTPKSSFGVVAE